MTTTFLIPFKLLQKLYLIDGSIRSAPENPYASLKTKLINRLNYCFADKIISNSYAGIKAFSPPLWKSVVINNGLDLTQINVRHQNPLIKEKYGIDSKYVIGMIASFSDTKDYKTYIKIAKNVIGKRDDVTFLAVGSGKNIRSIKVLAHKFDKIIFLGAQNDIDSIISIVDIGLHCTYTEGLSNSIMEFMAHGKPIIALGAGGIKELIINNYNGFFLNSGAVEKCSRKILYLLDNIEEARRLGRNGKNRIEKQFNIDKMIDGYRNLYMELLS